MRSQSRNNLINAYCVLSAEFLFILLPFVVSGIVFSYKGYYSKLLQMPDWSLAALVLTGQSLVKFISGMLANRNIFAAHWERVALGLSFLIVLCLIPSLIILCLVLIEGVPSTRLIFAQITMFVIGIIVFFAFGASGETLMRVKVDPSK